MRNIALGLLVVVLLSIIIEPLVEVLNVCREKIILGSALTNASRAAKDQSIIYESHRDLDAKIDEDRFVDYFAEAFESAIQVELTSRIDNTLKFNSTDGKYNSFTVTLEFKEEFIESERDDGSKVEQIISEVKVKAESTYKFKTKYLRIAESVGGDVDYQLTGERILKLSVKN
ncbi:hypothetical protein J2T13_001447 [Paenibacillus sp. DS2015]|uniref:hypothetical protein n=1 Tax=Paenibacillus sp. DS2015 TaxID=3373917 RepID=UPI003D1DDB25